MIISEKKNTIARSFVAKILNFFSKIRHQVRHKSYIKLWVNHGSLIHGNLVNFVWTKTIRVYDEPKVTGSQEKKGKIVYLISQVFW